MAGLQLRADQTWLFDATFQGFSMWVSDHGLDQASLNGLPLALNSMVLSAAHADAGFAVQLRAVIDRDLRLAIWPQSMSKRPRFLGITWSLSQALSLIS
jgi:hypothetical protein